MAWISYPWAADVADIVLMDPELTRLNALRDLSRRLDANLKRGLAICYTGMGIVVAGSFLLRIDVLVALGVQQRRIDAPPEPARPTPALCVEPQPITPSSAVTPPLAGPAPSRPTSVRLQPHRGSLLRD